MQLSQVVLEALACGYLRGFTDEPQQTEPDDLGVAATTIFTQELRDAEEARVYSAGVFEAGAGFVSEVCCAAAALAPSEALESIRASIEKYKSWFQDMIEEAKEITDQEPREMAGVF